MSITVSGDFIGHVHRLYFASLDYLLTKKGVRHGINGVAVDGLPAYVMAVASVEAFMNEAFLSMLPRFALKNSSAWNLPDDWLEKTELSVKLVLVPQLLFGKTFARGEQPYQDMMLLIRVRNDLIHYKMPNNVPKYIADLGQKDIILVAPSAKVDGSDYLWPDKLSCSEGIRWANNTACAIVHHLVSFVEFDYKKMIEGIASNFRKIEIEEVLRWFTTHGIDPDSHDPEKR
jgi:hypothetical protein